MRPLPALALLLALGCNSPRLAPAQGGVLARESGLAFARTFVGRTRSLSLHLANSSAAPRSVRLHAEPPFWAPEQVEVGPGATREVELQFRPAAPGAASGALAVEADGQPPASVALSGPAELAPTCAPSGPCLQAELDPDTGACIASPAGEGQPCAGACVTGGVCRAGACVGALLDCDDHDPCTADACDPAQGCVHAAAGPTCPAPPDPCQVPSCDPARPCALAPTPDGTACGPADCLTARVCLAGACVSRPVPEGAACGEPSPCQPLGVCRAGLCERGPVQPLQPAWTVDPPDGGGWLGFWGTTDEAGNLYLLENAPAGPSLPMGTSRLVSVTPDGYVRYRVSFLDTLSYQWLTQPMVAENMVLIASERSVQALRASDGTLVWRRDIERDFPNRTGTVLAADTRGRVFVGQSADRLGAVHSRVLALSAFDGSVLWSARLDGWLYNLIGDAQGRLYAFSNTGAPQPSGIPEETLTALGLGGEVLWAAPASQLTRGVPYQDELVGLSSPADQTLTCLQSFTSDGGSPWPDGADGAVIDLASASAAAYVSAAPVTTYTPLTLYRLDLGGRQAQRLTDLAHPNYNGPMVVTSRDTVLVPTRADDGTGYLEEVAPDGGHLLDCPLPGAWFSDTSLGQGWLYGTLDGRLAAFDLPGRELAPAGWPCYQGNAQGTRFAR